MRIHPINESNGASTTVISQQKPPLHTVQQHHRRHKDELNEIMEDVSAPLVTTMPETKQQDQNDRPGNNFVDDDVDDDFMARIVDGTCRGIFSSSGNTEDEHDRPSLCHLPSCQLGENLNVLMVRSISKLTTMS